jgi:hypothetical protein
MTMANPDLNDLSLLDEVVEVDGSVTSEEFFNPPLPDDGEHLVAIKFGSRDNNKSGIKIDRQYNKETKKRDGAGYWNIVFQLQGVKDGKVGGTIAFDNLTSLVMPSVGTSRVHMALDGSFGPNGSKMTLPATMNGGRPLTLGELGEEIKQAVAQSPQSYVTTQWVASINRGTKDDPNWEDVLKGQKNFPKRIDADGNETGKFEPEIKDPKSGALIRAQIKVLKYSSTPKLAKD